MIRRAFLTVIRAWDHARSGWSVGAGMKLAVLPASYGYLMGILWAMVWLYLVGFAKNRVGAFTPLVAVVD